MLDRMIADGFGSRVSPVPKKHAAQPSDRQAGHLKGRRRSPMSGLLEPLSEPLAQGWPASVEVTGAA